MSNFRSIGLFNPPSPPPPPPQPYQSAKSPVCLGFSIWCDESAQNVGAKPLGFVETCARLKITESSFFLVL